MTSPRYQPQEVVANAKNLSGESDRACIVLGVELLNVHLQQLFARNLQGDQQDLICGPLSSFETRARLAYGLGWISEEVASDLHTIGNVLSDYAQVPGYVRSFENPLTADRCAALRFIGELSEEENRAPGIARKRFETTVGRLGRHLAGLATRAS